MIDPFEEIVMESNQKYKGFIESAKFPDSLIKLMQIEVFEEREFLWKEFIKSIETRPDRNNILSKLANSYYVGFGNPYSSILFVGQEKAFDLVERVNLLYEESINNALQWKEIISQDLEGKQDTFQSKSTFSPQFPNAFHKVNKANHTWGFYSKIIAGVRDRNIDNYKQYLFEHTNYKSSLFNYCFMTELFEKPMKHHANNQISEERYSFLQHGFYRGFPIVVIGCAYMNNNKEIIEDLFNIQFRGSIDIDNRIPVNKFQSGNRLVLSTWQLSGSSGMSNLFLQKLSDAIRDHL